MADVYSTRRPISAQQIAWAAGFLEGEGSFLCHSRSPKVTAAQVQREPLDRLCEMFGGRLWLKQPTGFSKEPIWTWVLRRQRSVEVMMTVYQFMSPRRRSQIEFALSEWRAATSRTSPGAIVCSAGHAIGGANAQKVPSRRFPRCRICVNKGKRARRAKRAACNQAISL